VKVLIAGHGDLGERLRLRLQHADISATAFSRGARRGGLAADLYDHAAMRALAQVHDVVIFCAAPDARDEASYRRLYIDSLAPFLASSMRILFCASTAVYDVDNGAWCDEQHAINVNNLSFNGRVLVEAERRLRHGDLSLRLGGIYGPGRDYAVRQVRAGVPAQSQHWTNRIHIDDAASAIAHLLAIGATGCTNLVDNEPCTQADQYAFLRTLYDIAPVMDIDSRTSGKRVSNAQLRNCGFSFLYPTFRDGYSALKI
jgi:nucleoside-diphosphate-sugar epimerase